ncbi:MAG: pilus assembly protein TadG-related protein [Candidatus Velamenicoccus archaeovorus]
MRTATPDRANGDRGSVTLVTAALVGVILVLALGAVDLTRVLVAVARAQTAADAAALASAQEQAIPSGLDPAEVAAVFAAHNGAELIGCACAVGAFEATATVRVPVDGLALVPGTRFAQATARAEVDTDGPDPPDPAAGAPAP